MELHPPAHEHTARRADGRPTSEHVTDRHLTTRAVLEQEARILHWATTAIDPHRTAGSIDDDHLTAEQRTVAQAVAGRARLTLVVGPAGSGKTTTLAAATRTLRADGRPVVGLAPSGKAADILAEETGLPAVTLAKFLHEHQRPEPFPTWKFPPGTAIVLDEASMASTEDMDRLVTLTREHRWRLVAVGDPNQLPAVGRGGMFTHLCDTLPTHHLEDIRRFDEPWQAQASLKLRDGDPDAAAEYAAHRRVRTVHPAAIADRVARHHQRVAARGESIAITTGSQGMARAINVEIQRRRHPRLDGASAALHDGTRAFPGDRVASRRNHPHLETTSGTSVRNRHTWTVIGVHRDGALTVEDLDRGRVRLPADYVNQHVELGWAVTGYGTQGLTTEHSITVIEPSMSRASLYVGMTRGGLRNLAHIPDPTGTLDPTEALARAIQRPTRAASAHPSPSSSAPTQPSSSQSPSISMIPLRECRRESSVSDNARRGSRNPEASPEQSLSRSIACKKPSGPIRRQPSQWMSGGCCQSLRAAVPLSWRLNFTEASPCWWSLLADTPYARQLERPRGAAHLLWRGR